MLNGIERYIAVEIDADDPDADDVLFLAALAVRAIGTNENARPVLTLPLEPRRVFLKRAVANAREVRMLSVIAKRLERPRLGGRRQ